jgi:hypothetical protein
MKYPVSCPGVKRPGRGVNHPPPSSDKVKEREDLFLLLPLWAFMACFRTNFIFCYLSLKMCGACSSEKVVNAKLHGVTQSSRSPQCVTSTVVLAVTLSQYLLFTRSCKASGKEAK